MDDRQWAFIDAAGSWVARSYGMPKMTGRVLGWLMICDPPEQTAAQLAEALEASTGAISSATAMLVRVHLIERLRVRGERADRFRIRPEAWADQFRDTREVREVRQILAQGLDAIQGGPPSLRSRLEELDLLYGWLESRLPSLWEEWLTYKADASQAALRPTISVNSRTTAQRKPNDSR